MVFRDLVFLKPGMAVFLLIAVVILFAYWSLKLYRNKVLTDFSPISLHMMVPRSPTRYVTKVALIMLAWVFAVIAFMQPAGNARYLPLGKKSAEESSSITLMRKSADVILLIDASASMSVSDARSAKTRLDYAKEIAEEMVDVLTGENVSVYAFTSQTIPLVPPTLDYLFARIMINEIAINDGGVAGTSIVNALNFLAGRMTERPVASEKTIIILSDGGDTALEGMTVSERDKSIGEVVKALKSVPGGSVHVYSIGVGSKQGGEIPGLTYEGKNVHSVLDEGVMKSLAKESGGDYLSANAYSAYGISRDIISRIQEMSESEGQLAGPALLGSQPNSDVPLIYDHYFQIPLAFALICLGLYIWLPDVRPKEVEV